jgi:hypothetical protein
LSQQIPPVLRGSQPTDGGNLVVEEKDYVEVSSDPIAAKYLRPFRMGKELVRGLDRWCLWLEDVIPSDIAKSLVLKTRLEAVRTMREKSTKKATRELVSVPHLFAEIHQPDTSYVGIPRVVSETRPFYTVAHLPAEVIAGDKVYTAIDPDGFLFAIISSSMFITWQRAVGGALESRLRFSNTIVWNNLPLPEVAEDLRAKIITAGQKILKVREALAEKHSGRVSLADMYNPLAMSSELLKAHKELDRHVDKAFGAAELCASNNKRLEILFARYAELTAE